MSPDDSHDPRRYGWFSPLYWDLWIVGGLALATAIVALVSGTAGSLVRIGLALVYVLFVPGYAFVSALFPTEAPLDGLERVTFAFGLSIALTAFIALGLNFTPLGIRLVPIVAANTVFVVLCLVVAALRRTQLLEQPASDPELTPYTVPFERLKPLALDIRDELTGETAESRLEYALTILLVCSIIFAGASAVWALSTPRPGEEFTEFYLLTEQEQQLSNETELVAGNYPTELTTNQPAAVVVGIDNHEFESTIYRVVIRLRDPETNRTARIQTIDDIRIEHNETWLEPVEPVPPFTGTQLRLEFLLYRVEQDSSTPYRRLHLIVNVTAPAEQQTVSVPVQPTGPSHLSPQTVEGKRTLATRSGES